MIQPTDVLVVAVAAALRRPPPAPARRMTRGEARRAVQLAKAAWPRLRDTMFAELRRVA